MASKTLYVGNLNYNTMEQALAELFSSQGNVVDVRIMMGKGFGFVEMASEEDATRAKEALNGVQLDGRSIRVDEARPRRSRAQRDEVLEARPSKEKPAEDEPSVEEPSEEEPSTEEPSEEKLAEDEPLVEEASEGESSEEESSSEES